MPQYHLNDDDLERTPPHRFYLFDSDGYSIGKGYDTLRPALNNAGVGIKVAEFDEDKGHWKVIPNTPNTRPHGLRAIY